MGLVIGLIFPRKKFPLMHFSGFFFISNHVLTSHAEISTPFLVISEDKVLANELYHFLRLCYVREGN